MILVKIRGADAIVRGMANASGKAARVNHNRVGRLAMTIARKMKDLAPSKTGGLKKSIKTKAIARMRWNVTESKFYGVFQRRGARGGIQGSGYIFPVKKKALYWVGLAHPLPFVGPPVTRKHPGIKSNPYDYLAIRSSTPEIKKTAKDIGASYAQIITGNQSKSVGV